MYKPLQRSNDNKTTRRLPLQSSYYIRGTHDRWPPCIGLRAKRCGHFCGFRVAFRTHCRVLLESKMAVRGPRNSPQFGRSAARHILFDTRPNVGFIPNNHLRHRLADRRPIVATESYDSYKWHISNSVADFLTSTERRRKACSAVAEASGSIFERMVAKSSQMWHLFAMAPRIALPLCASWFKAHRNKKRSYRQCSASAQPCSREIYCAELFSSCRNAISRADCSDISKEFLPARIEARSACSNWPTAALCS